jgi:hypothetical protein
MSGRRRYAVYGACLESEIPFPELRSGPGADPRWSFELDGSLPPKPAGTLLGEEHIYGDVWARLFGDGEKGYWIEVSDTGLYHMDRGGRRIRWRPNPDPWWDFGRAHLLGRVLATSMYLEGILTLHGSGVGLGTGAVTFMAPKGCGKSTLAFALTRRGARLLSDDALPIDPPGRNGGVRVRPGVQSVRLTPESRRRFGAAPEARENREGKVVVGDLPRERLVAGPLPLAAAYLLRPVPASPSRPAAVRRELGKVEATLALAGQQKMAEMLGPGAAPELLERAAAVAARVPVYTLDVVRDFERLDEAVDLIVSWHHAGGSRA